MAIKDNKKDLKLGQSVVEAVQNADDNFTTLFDNDDDLQTQINGKEPKITTKNTAFNKNFATAAPVMDGTASAGSADTVARGDHKHPTDTSRLAVNPDGQNNLLDSNMKIQPVYLPDSVMGQLSYNGTWDASSSTATATSKTKGDYYVCSKGGRHNPDGTQIATGAEAYAVGDWAVYNGTSWDKVDNTDAVTMVNGQIGSVKTYKGTWAAATKYYEGDIVLSSNMLYVSLVDNNTGHTPTTTDTTYWKVTGKIYSAATTTAEGLMSATDKVNLDANTAARHTHSNKALLDTYDQTNANIKDAVTEKHTHPNKAILDNTTASFTTADETKLDSIDDSLLNKKFDDFGKVKDVTVNGTSVVGTDGVAAITKGTRINLTNDGTNKGTLTPAQTTAAVNDVECYVVLTGSGQAVNMPQEVYRRASYSSSSALVVFANVSSTSSERVVFDIAKSSWTYSQNALENASNKSTTIDKNSNIKYPTTKAVADYVANNTPVTDVQKPDGKSIVAETVAKLPGVEISYNSHAIAVDSTRWSTTTINGKAYASWRVSEKPIEVLNADGLSIVYQMKYSSGNNMWFLCVAEKQALTYVTISVNYN